MKLLKKLIPTSALLVATATSLVATSCSTKSDDFWMYDISTGMTPSIKPLEIKDNLTIDQLYDKYIEEIKANPKIWQEDTVYTLSNILRFNNEENKYGVDTSTYMKFGVSEPKIGLANYANVDGTLDKKPTFTFKVKLMFNNAFDISDEQKMVVHGETTIEYKNVMMFPFITNKGTMGVSLTGNSIVDILDSPIQNILSDLFKMNRNSADWSISINNDFTTYTINGADKPIQTQEIHEHDVELTSANDVVDWYLSHSTSEEGNIPEYIKWISIVLYNFNYSYHMSKVNLAPKFEPSANAGLYLTAYEKDAISFNGLLTCDVYGAYAEYSFDFATITSDLVLKEVDGRRTITFASGSHLAQDNEFFNLHGGVVDKEHEPSEKPIIYKLQNSELPIRITYTIDGNTTTSFQTITLPRSYFLAYVM